jgi:hypothetical protein
LAAGCWMVSPNTPDGFGHNGDHVRCERYLVRISRGRYFFPSRSNLLVSVFR